MKDAFTDGLMEGLIIGIGWVFLGVGVVVGWYFTTFVFSLFS